jgi:hypothetical protein
VERAFRLTMVLGSRLSAVLLAAGLVLWFVRPDLEASLHLLDAGVLLLMCVPLLRLGQSAARAVALRDWLHVGTIAAVAALLAATIWYAAHIAGA